MAIRFRKRLKIAPGVHLNLSGSGISASVGPKGATTNIKPGRKSKTTLSVPGTGVYSREDTKKIFSTPLFWMFVLVVVLLVVLK